jgi:hypothetical protein
MPAHCYPFHLWPLHLDRKFGLRQFSPLAPNVSDVAQFMDGARAAA